jgi:lactoylglutathione lyase
VLSVAVQAQQKGAILNHIALNVSNLEISTRFYQEVVGLDTITEPFHDGKHTWLHIGKGFQLHLLRIGKVAIEHPKEMHFCFSVPSIPNFIEGLKKRNIHFESWTGEKEAITKRVDGVLQIYLQDPDGYWLEINDDNSTH